MQFSDLRWFVLQKIFYFFYFYPKGGPFNVETAKSDFWIFQKFIFFFQKLPLWDLANVKRNKVMKFGDSNRQNVKMTD